MGVVTSRTLSAKGPCGVRDYSQLLTDRLAMDGLAAQHETIVYEMGGGLKGALRAGVKLARPVDSGAVVIHYASFGGTWKGVPLLAPWAPLLHRLRGSFVLTVVHEMYPGWGRSVKRATLSLLHRLALVPLVLGSHQVVVTTEGRADVIRRLPGARHRVHVHPVPSNWFPFGQLGAIDVSVTNPPPLMVLGWGHEQFDSQLLAEAIALIDGVKPTVVLVGAPGEESLYADRWRRSFSDLGIEENLQFTGYLSIDEVQTLLAPGSVVVSTSTEGLSSRKGTLASALAAGCSVVGVDGPETWSRLRKSGAVLLVEPTARALADGLKVITEPQMRSCMGRRAQQFYEANCGWASLSGLVAALLPDASRNPIL